MNDDQPVEQFTAQSPEITEAIKRAAFGALLAGGVCLFLGFSWTIDWPILDDEAAEQVWKQIDHAFRWSLTIVGVAFLVVAALAQAGRRASALLGTVVEGAFALLMLVMAIETILEQRASGGGFDVYAILLIIMMLVGVSAARHSWMLYKRSDPYRDADPA